MLSIATHDDVPFLRACLVEAAFPGATPRPADPIGDDHVARYLDGWGRQGDLGLVAWAEATPVGAAWVRLMAPDRPGYGFVDAATPELTVAVDEGHRGRGVGRALVAGVVDLAAVHGHVRVSLSVADEVNPGAVALYRSLGFAEVGRDDGGSLTMVSSTAPAPPRADACPPTARPAELVDGPALARLREVMFVADGKGGRPGWVAPFLAQWADGRRSGRLLASVVDDARGRPVASAVAALGPILPGPGREDGRQAEVSSVATQPAWRGRGAATVALTHLLAQIDALDLPRTRLQATAEGEGIYARHGFTRTAHVAMVRTQPVPHP